MTWWGFQFVGKEDCVCEGEVLMMAGAGACRPRRATAIHDG